MRFQLHLLKIAFFRKIQPSTYTIPNKQKPHNETKLFVVG